MSMENLKSQYKKVYHLAKSAISLFKSDELQHAKNTIIILKDFLNNNNFDAVFNDDKKKKCSISVTTADASANVCKTGHKSGPILDNTSDAKPDSFLNKDEESKAFVKNNSNRADSTRTSAEESGAVINPQNYFKENNKYRFFPPNTDDFTHILDEDPTAENFRFYLFGAIISIESIKHGDIEAFINGRLKNAFENHNFSNILETFSYLNLDYLFKHVDSKIMADKPKSFLDMIKNILENYKPNLIDMGSWEALVDFCQKNFNDTQEFLRSLFYYFYKSNHDVFGLDCLREYNDDPLNRMYFIDTDKLSKLHKSKPDLYNEKMLVWIMDSATSSKSPARKVIGNWRPYYFYFKGIDFKVSISKKDGTQVKFNLKYKTNTERPNMTLSYLESVSNEK